jgi:membrane-bound lytic murein transglycosylase B
MMKRIVVFFALLMVVCVAQAKQPWSDWVGEIKSEAIAKGIRAETVDSVFSRISQPSPRVLKLDRTQPERRITFLKYRNTRAGAYRIKMGQRMYKKYKPVLDEISQKYGVSPCFILSFWGLETSYGNFMGKFPVIQSLSTLAYDSRRSEFFRKQLFFALQMIDEGHVSYDDLKGEWAGASGHPQFLPSSWYNYAVDHDDDGKRDIWKTKEDAFASIANYLIGHNWKTGEPWAITVMLPKGFDRALIDDKTKLTVAEWKGMGLRLTRDEYWPNSDLKARVVFPDGGPAMLAFNNFDTIMKWNRSTYYAGTVGYMAEKICQTRLR